MFHKIIRNLKIVLAMGGVRAIASTIFFNFKMFPIKDAVKLPILIISDVNYKYTLPGTITIDEDALHFGCLTIGYLDRQYTYDRPSFIKIRGKLIIHGSGIHQFAGGTTLEITENAICEIGNNFTTSHNNRIRIVNSLRIGDDNMWSYYNVILDNDGHQIFDNHGNICNNSKGIVIGNNVWLGCRNIVIKGTIIPNNVIVAPGSIINKHYTDEDCIITSFGKTIKRNIAWSRNLS